VWRKRKKGASFLRLSLQASTEALGPAASNVSSNDSKPWA